VHSLGVCSDTYRKFDRMAGLCCLHPSIPPLNMVCFSISTFNSASSSSSSSSLDINANTNTKDSNSKKELKPIVTYISRQSTGRRLTPEDHEGLVKALRELEEEGICEIRIPVMEHLNLGEQIAEVASSTVSFLFFVRARVRVRVRSSAAGMFECADV
jgi:hypothetical protein